MSLSKEQEADCQEAFTLFDRGGSGKLKVAELGGVLRALGHNLAGDELCVAPRRGAPACRPARSRPSPRSAALLAPRASFRAAPYAAVAP